MSNPLGFVQANLLQLADYSNDLTRLHGVMASLRNELAGGSGRVQQALVEFDQLMAEIQPERALKDLDAAVHESLEGARRIRSSLYDLQGLLGTQTADDSAELSEVVANATQALRAAAWPCPKVGEEVAPGICVRAPAATLRRILLTLLLRASEAIAARHADEPDAPGEVRVYAGRRGGEICLSITDTGMPLSATERTALTRIGTGEAAALAELGLARVGHKVRDLGGTLGFDSSDGGSHIELRLPAAPRA